MENSDWQVKINRRSKLADAKVDALSSLLSAIRADDEMIEYEDDAGYKEDYKSVKQDIRKIRNYLL